MKKIAGMMCAAFVMALSAPAMAEDDGVRCTTSGKWMSKSMAKSRAVGMGYKVRKVKREHGCYEIYALKGGARLELFMNPVSGKIVKIKKKS